MTLRYKIANWLTGNALRSMAEDIEDLGVSLDNTMSTCMHLEAELSVLNSRLTALAVTVKS